MKALRLLVTMAYLALMVSCGHENNSHTHEGEATHTHEGEADATHSHEGEAAQTYEGEADATHSHEGEAANTHEGEADATHSHEGEAAHTHEGEAETGHTHETDITTDQQNSSGPTVDHKTLTVSKQKFSFVKKTSGQIMVDKKDEVIITAKSPGIVRFSDHFLYPGLKMAKGESLFSISGEDLTENNAAVNFARVEANFDKAKSDLERASELIEDKLITQEHYLQTKSEFQKAEAEYKVYTRSANNSISVVKSPQSCFLKDLFVQEGEKVEAGDKLASILIEHKMVLRADVPPTDFDMIQRFESAKFATGYSNSVYNTKKMNGSKISYGKSSGENSFYIPVYFRLDFNSELIPGTFADIWLIGNEIDDAIVIPNNAILEEYGKFYVYIDHGDHFDKRFITPGESDGEYTHIVSGLNESESIVTDGVYQIKMSMMTSIPNTHDHSH